jgi:Txe/YoeB family toxin of toxin-antitoxin system
MNYRIEFTKRAAKDYELIKRSPLKGTAYKILQILKTAPYTKPFEQLKDNLKGACSRRLNLQHRIVYTIREEEKKIVILSMWTHYENTKDLL